MYCRGLEIQACHVLLGNEEQNEEVRDGLDGNFQAAKKQVVEKFERDYVERLLLRHNGNVTQAAREAGKERRAFGRMVKKYAITLDSGRHMGDF